MIVDTSALLAILEDEPEARRMVRALATAGEIGLSAATLVEAGIVVEARRGTEGARDLDLIIARLGIQTVPMTSYQAGLAREAWRRFGKGRHPAGLNMADCFTYAIASETGQPLLAKGEDFPRTDLRLVEY